MTDAFLDRNYAPGERLNVGLVGSSGGHLAHLLILKPWWEHHDRFWVTFDMPDSHELLESERCDWAYYPTTRNVPNLLRNFGLAWRVLRRERPDVLISTGAAVAFPFFLLGRLMGVKTVFIEVYDRIDNASLTARLCAPLSLPLRLTPASPLSRPNPWVPSTPNFPDPTPRRND